MAILYTFTVDDPTGAGPFPLSVLNSDWYAGFLDNASFTAIGGNTGFNWAFIFADKKALDSWLADYAVTDQDLLDDLNKWTVDHQVTYKSNFYTLPETTGKGII